VIVACDGSAITTAPHDGPISIHVSGTVLRATVDGVAGTLTFAPVHTDGPLTLSRIYGDQGRTVQLYNSPVSIVTSAGRKTFSANVGIRNLLPHSIGDEQSGASPLATMGIHVFITSGPTVTATSSPCNPSCTIGAQNYHGTLPFHDLNQRYWFWDERVGAAGSGNDTTTARKLWVFEGNAAVTSFQFDVLVSAAWPAPFDTRWRQHYDGDSLPDLGAEPRWGVTNTSAIRTVSQGILNLVTVPNGEMEFYRLDSLSSTTDAWAETRLRFTSESTSGRAVIHLRDGVKYVALGVASGLVGFVRSATSFPFIASWPIATSEFRTYQLRKYGADSVVIYVDQARIGAIPYASLSAPSGPQLGTRFQFGCPQTSAVSFAEWDFVIFEIGVPQP
jgi:hypothetical protein